MTKEQRFEKKIKKDFETFRYWPLYQVPHISIKVFGIDKKGNTYEGQAFNIEEYIKQELEKQEQAHKQELKEVVERIAKHIKLSNRETFPQRYEDFQKAREEYIKIKEEYKL